MNKKILIFILYSLIIAIIISLKLYSDHESNLELKEMIVEQESESLAALTLSLRETYQKAFVDNHIPLDSNTLNLLPVRTANNIAKTFSRIIKNETSIRTVSDRPRNPKNKANENEMKIISFFQNNPLEESFFKDIDTSYYYAVPLRIEQSCLNCHGSRQSTIPLIRDRYKNAYDYKLGDLRGIISINMTKREILESIIAKQKTTVLSAIFIYFLLITIGFIVVRIIINNERKFTNKLELKVKENTKELIQLNENLKYENENSSALNEELNQSIEELVVTKEHLAEQKQIIEESEIRFRKLINTFSSGLYILNSDYKITYVNEPFKKEMGRDIVGETCHKAIYNLDNKCSWCIYKDLKKSKDSISYDLNVKDSTLRIKNILLDDNSKLTIREDITTQKRIEVKLKESEEKFRKITNSANDAIILIDNNEKVALWNTAAQNIFGYTEDEILGKNLHEILPAPKYRNKAHNAFSLFRKSGKGDAINRTIEVEGIRKDGNIVPVELSLSAIKINNQWSAVGIIRDISARKEYDKALKESKERNEELVKRFEDTVENMEDVFFQTNKQFIYTQVSPSIKKYLKIESLDQIIGKPLNEFWNITEQELKKLTLNILKHGFIKEMLFEYLTTNKEIRFAKINARVLYDKTNKIRGVEGIIRDVTLDMEYQNRIKELNNQKEVLIDNIPSSIYYKDINLRYLEINNHFAQLLNKDPKEIIGKTDREVASDDIAFLYEDLDRKVIETKTPIVNFIKNHKIDDSKNHWVSTSKIPYLDSDNHVAGIIGVVRDITEQVEYENAIQESKNKIEIAHKHITDNINYAKTIQNALLPSQEIINEFLPDSFVLFKPKDKVSGDFYFFKKFEEHLVFAAADCTGHGVSGGFLTMLGITNLNDIVSSNEVYNPATALNQLREKIKNTYKLFGSENQNGLDIALCALNTKTNILSYAGAYNPLWIVRDKELIEYKATRNPIGFYYKEIDFESHQIQLQKNDIIYIFSDGYADQFGGELDKKYSAKRFKRFLISINHLPLKEQKEALFIEFNKWKGNQEQIDDVVIFGVRV